MINSSINMGKRLVMMAALGDPKLSSVPVWAGIPVRGTDAVLCACRSFLYRDVMLYIITSVIKIFSHGLGVKTEVKYVNFE